MIRRSLSSPSPVPTLGVYAVLSRRLPILALIVLTSVALPALAAAPSPVEGHWEGAVETPGMTLAVVVDLAREDGAWRGVIDIPAQGAEDLDLESIAVEGTGAAFAIAGVPGTPTFDGELADDGETLAGTFTQSGQSFPFSLTRAGAAELPAAGPAPEEALAGFDAWMTGQLERFSVPGAAVGVIRDGEVILAEGFGVRNLETGEPVTAETRFAIGSVTKSFTAALVGSLVDDGAVEWDAPVRTYLPDLALRDEIVADRLTPRDLLTHRSGLPRHDLVWYGSDATREELYRSLRFLEPTRDLREQFQYQNLVYMTAGHLAERVAGSSWEELVEERFFGPLGMGASTTSVSGLEDAPDAATGYREREVDGDGGEGAGDETDDESLEPLPYRDLDAIGPAGAINSSVTDMLEWTRFHLGDGSAPDGTPVLSPTVLGALHTPQIVVNQGLFSVLLKQQEMPYLMYGMGWFVQPFRGHEMIQHGGNIDGFSALVAMLPGEDLGVVVLTNKDGTFLTYATAYHLFDRFLGVDPAPWPDRYGQMQDRLEGAQEAGQEAEERLRVEGTAPSHPLGDYAGTFSHPAYGEVVVTREEEGLRLAYHTLESSLEHWHYDVFRAAEGEVESLKLAYRTDLRGRIDGLSVALEGGVDPIVFTKQPPEGLYEVSYLEPFVGSYELMGLRVTVALRDDGTLTLAVPGQSTQVLEPAADGEFDLAGEEGFSVRFVEADGEVVEMILIQPTGVFVAARAEEAEPADGT